MILKMTYLLIIRGNPKQRIKSGTAEVTIFCMSEKIKKDSLPCIAFSCAIMTNNDMAPFHR